MHYPDRTYVHTLTPGPVSALRKLQAAVHYYGRNEIHIHDEMKMSNAAFKLTDFEWNNFSQLRFHALAFKVDGKPGYWGITARGAAFLKGETPVPLKVKTFRNQVISHSEERITIADFRNKESHFETKPDFELRNIDKEAKQLQLA